MVAKDPHLTIKEFAILIWLYGLIATKAYVPCSSDIDAFQGLEYAVGQAAARCIAGAKKSARGALVRQKLLEDFE